MTTHQLKTWPEFFEPVAAQRKNFEVRKFDRLFNEGDTLDLREWDQSIKVYTGRRVTRKIEYILQGGQFGIEPGYVVLGLSV